MRTRKLSDGCRQWIPAAWTWPPGELAPAVSAQSVPMTESKASMDPQLRQIRLSSNAKSDSEPDVTFRLGAEPQNFDYKVSHTRGQASRDRREDFPLPTSLSISRSIRLSRHEVVKI